MRLTKNHNILLNSFGIFFIILLWPFSARSQTNFQWAVSANGPKTDEAYSIFTDKFGNVYQTGFFRGTVDFDPSIAEYNLTSETDLYEDIFILKLDKEGQFIWAFKIGGEGTDQAFDIYVDMDQNIYISGSFEYTVDFDPSPGVYNLSVSGTAYIPDAFILKLDGLGNFLWAKKFGSTGYQQINDITSDNLGNIFIVGNFWETVDFDPSISTYNMTADESDCFILCLDNDANFIWAKQFSGPGTGSGNSICIDNEAIYIIGEFTDEVDLDPGAGSFIVSAVYTFYDLYISKLNHDGEFIWGGAIGQATIGADQDYGKAIVTDKFSNIYVCGSFEGTTDFDFSEASYELTPLGLWSDAFIAKYDKNGQLIWAKQFGGASADDQFTSLSISQTDQVFATGNLNSYSLDIFISPDTLTFSSGDGNGYLIELDSNGNTNWLFQAIADMNNIYIDTIGNIYVTGSFGTATDFDPGPGTYILTPDVAADVFVLKLGANPIVNVVEKDQISTNQINIYPNPSSGSCSIKFKQIYNGAVTVTIFNSIGCKVNELKYANSSMLNFTLPDNQDLYFVEVHIDTHIFYTTIVKL